MVNQHYKQSKPWKIKDKDYSDGCSRLVTVTQGHFRLLEVTSGQSRSTKFTLWWSKCKRRPSKGITRDHFWSTRVISGQLRSTQVTWCQPRSPYHGRNIFGDPESLERASGLWKSLLFEKNSLLVLLVHTSAFDRYLIRTIMVFFLLNFSPVQFFDILTITKMPHAFLYKLWWWRFLVAFDRQKFADPKFFLSVRQCLDLNRLDLSEFSVQK